MSTIERTRPTPTATPGRPRPAAAPPPRRRRGVWALWAILGVLLLLGTMLVAANTLGDDPEASLQPGTAERARSVPAPGTSEAGPATASTVLALDGGRVTGTAGALLPVPVDLGARIGEDVTAEAIPVQSVVSDEGFWVGANEKDRLFVHLVADGESPIVIESADRISFAATLVRLPPVDIATWRISAEEGAELLQIQGSYLEATGSSITVV